METHEANRGNNQNQDPKNSSDYDENKALIHVTGGGTDIQPRQGQIIVGNQKKFPLWIRRIRRSRPEKRKIRQQLLELIEGRRAVGRFHPTNRKIDNQWAARDFPYVDVVVWEKQKSRHAPFKRKDKLIGRGLGMLNVVARAVEGEQQIRRGL